MSVPHQQTASQILLNAALLCAFALITGLPRILEWMNFLFHELEGEFAAFAIPSDVWVYFRVFHLWINGGGIALSVVLVVAASLSTPTAEIAKWVKRVFMVASFGALASIVLFVIANSEKNELVQRFQDRDPMITSAFDAFYCHAQGTKLCGKEKDVAKLLRMFSGEDLCCAKSSSTSDFEAMENAFYGCRYAFTANGMRISTAQHRFLDKYSERLGIRVYDTTTVSREEDAAVNAWCGHFLLTASGSPTTARRLASHVAPSTAHDEAFVAFVKRLDDLFAVDLKFVVVRLLVLGALGLFR